MKPYLKYALLLIISAASANMIFAGGTAEEDEHED